MIKKFWSLHIAQYHPHEEGYSLSNNAFGGLQNFPQYFQGVTVYITTLLLVFLAPVP